MTSTKQLRISDPAEIRKKIPGFLGKKINIVLADSRVVIGELKQVKTDGVVLLNMRLKKMFFPFSQLSEIYFDTPVA